MKKALSLILVIAMIVCLVPAIAVSAAKEKAPRITVDGKVDDWKGLDTLELVGKDETSDRNVIFYGYRAANGLYLACKAVHKTLITDRGNWWENNNFEIFVWNNKDEKTQYWVRTGLEEEKVVAVKSDNITSAVVESVKDGDYYTTVYELFIENEKLPENQRSAEYLPLGMAHKINNGAGVYEDIKGGGGNEYDSYWVNPFCWPGMCSLIATNSGLYTGYDHWVVDGGSFQNTGRVRWPNFTTYMLGETEEEVTLSATFKRMRTKTEPENNGGDYGFFFGVKDNNGDGIIQEGGDLYLMVDYQANGIIGVERNNGGWGGWAAEYNASALAAEGEEIKMTATYNKATGNLKVYVNDGTEPVIDWTDSEPLAGTGYALASKVTNAQFKNVTVNGKTPSEKKQVVPTADYYPAVPVPEADEKSAQSENKGTAVVWADHNWCGSEVTLTEAVTEGDTTTVSFTHTGTCPYGVQYFYNPANAENGQKYDVKLTLTSSVDTKVTVNGETVTLKANTPKKVSYTVELDMHPEDANFNYGTSAVSIQLGDKPGNGDIVDGTYTIQLNSVKLHNDAAPTGDAAVIAIAAVALISLAGVAVVASKRRIAE